MTTSRSDWDWGKTFITGSGDLSLIVGNNITDASHDLIISVRNNIMYLFIVH